MCSPSWASMVPAAAMAAAIFRSRTLREISDIAFPHLFRQILRHAPGQGDDGERGILVRIAGERSAVRHEKVLHVMRLAVLIQHAGPGIVAHTRGAHLVNNSAAARDHLGPTAPARRGLAVSPAAAVTLRPGDPEIGSLERITAPAAAASRH